MFLLRVQVDFSRFPTHPGTLLSPTPPFGEVWALDYPTGLLKSVPALMAWDHIPETN